MGNTNAKRVQFKGREQIQNPKDSNLQDLNFTGYFQIGDVVDFVEVDSQGNVLSVIADNITIQGIDPDTSIALGSSVDTSNLPNSGTPVVVAQPVDDAQEAIDRLFRREFQGDVDLPVRQDILAQELDSPIAGQTSYDVDDASFFRAGDTVSIFADEGKQGEASIVSVSPNADATNNRATVVISSVIDISGVTNPFILDTITVEQGIRRNQERIDGIDQPIENEDLGVGDAVNVAFETNELMVQNSSKLLLDGRRLKLGTPGTRATLTQGTGDSQLIFTSMILGEDGNNTQVEVSSGTGINVSVSGNFQNGFTIVVTDDGGSATANQIADAINNDADARRLIQVQPGGNGTGTVAAFGPTALTGGLDDGTGDYAELEQVFEGFIVGTGFKWISLHIRPNERNRLNSPPDDDEDLVVDYRKAAENVDR